MMQKLERIWTVRAPFFCMYAVEKDSESMASEKLPRHFSHAYAVCRCHRSPLKGLEEGSGCLRMKLPFDSARTVSTDVDVVLVLTAKLAMNLLRWMLTVTPCIVRLYLAKKFSSYRGGQAQTLTPFFPREYGVQIWASW